MRYFLFLISFFLLTCYSTDQHLPFLGQPTIVQGDTLFPRVKPFRLINQDSHTINLDSLKGKIFISNFIFLSCPTICPRMTEEMKKVYGEFRNQPSVILLSHTIDPDHDHVERLKLYAENLEISSKKWHFLTGLKDSIYQLATSSYYVSAYLDSSEPGGIVHNGALILVDKNKYLRGVYDGTNPKETKRLINDIYILLKE